MFIKFSYMKQKIILVTKIFLYDYKKLLASQKFCYASIKNCFTHYTFVL